MIPVNLRCKNPQQNISKLNSSIHEKDQSPSSSWVYPRDERLTQHRQIDKCDSPHWQNEGGETKCSSIGAGKAFTKFDILLVITTLNKLSAENCTSTQ